MIFKDKKGREWSVAIDVGVARNLKKSGVNIYQLEEDKAAKLRELIAKENELDLMEFIWKIVKPQADEVNVTEDDFYSGLAGVAIADARIAFMESYANFTQSPAIHSMMMETVDMQRRAEKTMERAAKQIIQLARKQYADQESQISETAIEQLFASELNKRQEQQANQLQLRQTA